MVTQTRVASYEEFERFIALPENRERRFALLHGEIIEMSPSRKHGSLASVLHGEMYVVFKQRGVGELYIEVRYRLPHDQRNALIPDISYIENTTGLPGDTTPIARMPDLAVEIKSPDNTYQELRDKAAYSIANGARLVWLVLPEKRLVEVYRPGVDLEILDIHDTLDGGDVLPGFSLPLKALFGE